MEVKIFKTNEPVVLDGYQAVLKPSKFGYSMACTINQDLIGDLENNRVECLEWAESKLLNPKRSTLKPEPWEEVSEGKYKIKFSWNEESKPYIMDCSLSEMTSPETPIYSGSKVRIIFNQMAYVLRDRATYGTTLKLLGAQVIELSASNNDGVPTYDFHSIAEMFGQQEGYRQRPN